MEKAILKNKKSPITIKPSIKCMKCGKSMKKITHAITYKRTLLICPICGCVKSIYDFANTYNYF